MREKWERVRASPKSMGVFIWLMGLFVAGAVYGWLYQEDPLAPFR